jgi:general secretion pathway protein G
MSLQELVDEGYLRKVPVDPITGSAESWEEVLCEVGEDLLEETGICDVKSSAQGTGYDGTPYTEW